jgi:hypothetical protein
MKKTVYLILFILFLSASAGQTVSAQCAMCTISAEQGTKNGNTQGNGLNSGIMYLLAIPYVLLAGVGVLWYKKYRSARSARVS